jgi:hypothetical protein
VTGVVIVSYYEILTVADDFVILRGSDIGGYTLESDAMRVVPEVLRNHPGSHIFFYDRGETLTEMLHEDGNFIGFSTCTRDVIARIAH